MTEKHIIDGCEFQSYCIEYKDISYLKIMPICAIHELSIACHDKENKCKYYKLYKQLKRSEAQCEAMFVSHTDLEKKYEVKDQECEELKQTLKEIKDIAKSFCDGCQEFEPEKRGINCIYCNYGKILQLIRDSEIKHES